MKGTDTFQTITPHLLLTRDESLILDELADHNEMPLQWNSDRIISFFSGDDFHLVLYFAKEDDRGLQMFLVRDFARHTDDLVLLRAIFEKLIEKGINSYLFGKARYRIDSLLHMTDTFIAIKGESDWIK